MEKFFCPLIIGKSRCDRLPWFLNSYHMVFWVTGWQVSLNLPNQQTKDKNIFLFYVFGWILRIRYCSLCKLLFHPDPDSLGQSKHSMPLFKGVCFDTWSWKPWWPSDPICVYSPFHLIYVKYQSSLCRSTHIEKF